MNDTKRSRSNGNQEVDADDSAQVAADAVEPTPDDGTIAAPAGELPGASESGPAVVLTPPEPAAPASEPQETPYYELAGTWNGVKRYQCLRCPFDSTDGEDVMAWHVTKHVMADVDEAAAFELRARTSHGG